MFEQKTISIETASYDKSAIIYYDQKITPKACILVTKRTCRKGI